MATFSNVVVGSKDVSPSRRVAETVVIDLTHLRRYTLGDEALEKEVLELFLAQLPLTIAALSTAPTDRDWRIAAHTLKGSGRAVGAARIARLAEDAENVVGSSDLRQKAVAKIVSAAREAKDFIQAHYGADCAR